ncbi:MAG TPA: nitroreductase family protein [Streptosporangiaceae bacterium]|nr:nitroreductase family protein [Streptosporangiaceae bacterium]
MTTADTGRDVDPASLLALLSTRRVVRDFGPEPVEDAQLWMILEAGRWATCASNNRVHRLLVVQDRQQVRLVADMSPGIFSHPAVMVVICTDLQAVAAAGLRADAEPTVFIDVGTLMMNMMTEAHALGLGTCPATSFSRAGVEAVLGLPAHARPEAILQIGHPAAARPPVRPWRSRPSRLVTELVHWERYGQAPPLPPG